MHDLHCYFRCEINLLLMAVVGMWCNVQHSTAHTFSFFLYLPAIHYIFHTIIIVFVTSTNTNIMPSIYHHYFHLILRNLNFRELDWGVLNSFNSISISKYNSSVLCCSIEFRFSSWDWINFSFFFLFVQWNGIWRMAINLITSNLSFRYWYNY